MPTGHYKRSLTPLKDRLFSKTIITETCWLWVGSKSSFGHGQIAIGGYGKEGKRLVFTHRASWEIHKGEIPINMFVLHMCDVPNCINPNHLFLGTKKDNTQDMLKKGRMRLGYENPKSKLCKKQVEEILSSALPQSKLADIFSVSQATICLIKNGKRYHY